MDSSKEVDGFLLGPSNGSYRRCRAGICRHVCYQWFLYTAGICRHVCRQWFLYTAGICRHVCLSEVLMPYMPCLYATLVLSITFLPRALNCL